MKHCPLPPARLPLSVLAALVLPVVSAPAGPSAAPGQAGEPAPREKGGYSLFKTTPRDALREFSTDRPDQTESPFTVDAGLEFAVTESVQLDVGCNVGVSHGADDVNPFVGLSVRF